MSVVLALASSAEARPRSGDDRWERDRRAPIFKIIKKLAMKCFGDLITDPKPKP